MKRTLIIALASLTLTAAPAAFAGGSGGGGGSLNAPSGPSYDPVEEYQKGVEALKSEDYKAAEKAFKRVAKVAPKDANTQYLLGMAHDGQDEYGSAAKAYSKAVKYDAANYDAHARLVIAHMNNGKDEKAAKAEANLTKAKTDCAGTCEAAAKIDEAIAKVNAAHTSTDTSAALPESYQNASLEAGDAMYSSALRLINLERYDEGIADLQTAQRAVGPHPDILTYLGFANRKLGNTDAAFGYYSAALAIDPEHLSANEYLGEYYVELGDMDRAQAQLEKLEGLCPFGCAQTVELQRWIDEADA